MEDPYGHDISDFSLEEFCVTIERKIKAINDCDGLLKYNLALGPNINPSMTPREVRKSDDGVEVGLSDDMSQTSSVCTSSSEHGSRYQVLSS